MFSIPKFKLKRRDKRVVGLLLIFLFFFVQWIFDFAIHHEFHTWKKIGHVLETSGQVNSRQEGEWKSVVRSADLHDGEELHLDQKSQARLQLLDHELILSSQTEITVEQRDGNAAIELTRGSAQVRLAAEHPMTLLSVNHPMVQVYARVPTEFLIVSGPDGQPVIQTLTGRLMATLNGEQVELGPLQVLQPRHGVHGLGQGFVFKEPVPNLNIYGLTDQPVIFRWDLPGWKLASIPGLTLEMSTDPRFTHPEFHQVMESRFEFQTILKEDREFYYRLTDTAGHVSPIQRLNFVRMQAPKLTLKVADFSNPTEFPVGNEVEAQLEHDPRAVEDWLQISADNLFRAPLVNERVRGGAWKKEIPPGSYWVRAKSLYSESQHGDWCIPEYITVQEPKVLPLTWPRSTLVGVFLDSSLSPEAWTEDTDEGLQRKLQSNFQFQGFFRPLIKGSEPEDRIEITSNRENDSVELLNGEFPAAWIRPGHQELRFRRIRGAQTTAWSPAHGLDISIAPPIFKDRSLPLRVPAADDQISFSIAWNKVFFAEQYELESWTQATPLRRLHQNLNENALIVSVAQNESRVLRVRGLGADGQPMTPWSSPIVLNRQKPKALPEPPHLAGTQLGLINRSPAQENQSSLKIDRWTSAGFPFQFWSWFGTGLNAVGFQQEVTGKVKTDFSEIAGPSFYVEAGGIHQSGWGGIVSYKSTPGDVQINNAPLDNKHYEWTSLSADLLKRANDIRDFLGGHLSSSGLLGLQDHSIPFLAYLPNNSLSLKKINILNGSVGFLTQVSRGSWRYDWLMRYQYPLSSSGASGTEFTVKPKFTFDGLVGASYQMMSKWRVGAFWYGQMHSYQFDSQDSNGHYTGDQNLIYSNLDLRLGYEF